MKFTLERADLLAAMSRAGGIVARRNTIPILSTVMIEATSTNVVIKATNLDMEATVTISAAVAARGKCCVEADKLSQIAKAVADGSEIAFDLGERLAVKSGRSRFALAVQPPENFPVFASFAATTTITELAPFFRHLIARPAFSMAPDGSRYIMFGVNLSVHGGKLYGAATDGKRFALAEIETELSEFSIIIPSPMVAEMSKLLDGSGEVATLGISPDKVSIAMGGVEIVSKLVDGAFPDVWRAIPAEFPHAFVVNRDETLAAVRRAAIVIDDKARSIGLAVDHSVLAITARGSQTDEAADEVTADGYMADPFSWAMNSGYVLDALSAVRGDEAEIFLTGHKARPVKVQGVKDKGFVCFLMPLVAS